jgi:hypothetical protein
VSQEHKSVEQTTSPIVAHAREVVAAIFRMRIKALILVGLPRHRLTHIHHQASVTEIENNEETSGIKFY